MTQPVDHVPSASPATETTPALRACLFTVSGARFAVDVRSAREVALFEELTPVPRAPRHLVGVANLRGTVIPIVDAGPLLGLSGLRAPRSVRTLVLRDGPLLAAMVVDAALGLEPFDTLLPPDAPGVSRDRVPSRFLSGWLTWTGELVPILDAGRLLAELRSGGTSTSARRTAA